MKKSLMLRLILLLVLVWGCGRDVGSVGVDPTPDDLVIANCLALQKALEDYAAENDGGYPLDRNALLDFLPGGELPKNPFTGNPQPSRGLAVHPGQTGYLLDWSDPQGLTVAGYVITGFGESGQVILINKNYPDSILALELLTMANSIKVREAAERFAAENNGIYPANVSVDTTPDGNWLIGLLPDGLNLLNVFTGAWSEPTNGAAAVRGAVGYVPIVGGGVNSGYTITAFGRFGLISTLTSTPELY